MKTKKDKQGVSLIVLVITIIVMIILAAAIILTLNNSGIINRANEAVEKTDLAQVKHIATLKWSEAYWDNKTSQTELYNAVRDGLIAEDINPDDYNITVTEQGVDVKTKIKYANETPVPENWRGNVVAIVDTVPIPKGFVASQATGEDTKLKGLVIYEGTEAVTDTNVENAKRTRNQYVWVPVASEDFTTKFLRQNFGKSEVISNTLGADFWEVALETTTNMPLAEQNSNYITLETVEGGITNTLVEVQTMYASIKEYEGFYIARYEAGIDTKRTSNNGVLETKVYSMMGKIPYTELPWTRNNVMNQDINGAVQVARSIYPVTNTEYGVVSTLTYGVQWDTVLQWWSDTKAIEDLNNSSWYGNFTDHVINSTNELNEDAKIAVYNRYTGLSSYVPKEDATIKYPKDYQTSWLLSTGALKAARVNNIYDMAGNVEEWTMEGKTSVDDWDGSVFNTRVYRGGNYLYTGNSSVTARLGNSPSLGSRDGGFRPCLYIKK